MVSELLWVLQTRRALALGLVKPRRTEKGVRFDFHRQEWPEVGGVLPVARNHSIHPPVRLTQDLGRWPGPARSRGQRLDCHSRAR